MFGLLGVVYVVFVVCKVVVVVGVGVSCVERCAFHSGSGTVGESTSAAGHVHCSPD